MLPVTYFQAHEAWVLERFSFVMITCACLVGCGRPVTEEECFELLSHYTEKVIDQARPSTGKAERSELVLEAQQKAELDPEFAACTSRVSRAEFECAMVAKNADEIERCLM